MLFSYTVKSQTKGQVQHMERTEPRIPSPPPIGDALSVGYLTVAAGSANRAYPLPDVRVEIYIPDESGTPTLLRSDVTNESGVIPTVAIPTPAEAASLTPQDGSGNGYLPYTTARVRLFRNGYYPMEAMSVPVFPGIRSLQYFDLIPITKGAQYDAPTGTFLTVSEDITDLLQ